MVNSGIEEAYQTHLLGKLRQDDFTNIVPQLGLELETALAVK